jgi:hypothetical protein
MTQTHTCCEHETNLNWERLLMETDFETPAERSLHVLARYDMEQNGD